MGTATLTIIISTILILSFAAVIVYFLFFYQKKRFRHQQDLLELREAYNQTLLQSKLEIQEQTLDHISKELHANFSQLVSLININLAGILPNTNEQTREGVLETKSLAKQLLSELKSLSASLNTDLIMKIGFGQSLENELNRLTKTKRFQVSLTKKGEEFRIRPEHEIILFRLCQEVLNNIVTYAKASSIHATINYDQDLLKLEIMDDGIGFDLVKVMEETNIKQSTGLINMKKRAKLIRAEILIDTAPGKGTKVTILLNK